MSTSQAAVEITDVSFRYEGIPVIDKVSLTLPEGDFLGIIGPNGSGKTTLLRMILGLLSPLSGTLRVFGVSPMSNPELVGYVPQHFHFDRDFPVSVMDVVLMGRLAQTSTIGGYRPEDRALAQEALKSVDVYELRNNLFGTLSGGERQRVLIARAFVSRPRLLLLDEPTAGVDSRAEQDIYELLKRLNERATIVLVTHDLGFISAYVKRVACLNQRLVCHPTAQVTAELIEELYQGPVRLVQHDHVHGTFVGRSK